MTKYICGLFLFLASVLSAQNPEYFADFAWKKNNGKELEAGLGRRTYHGRLGFDTRAGYKYEYDKKENIKTYSPCLRAGVYYDLMSYQGMKIYAGPSLLCKLKNERDLAAKKWNKWFKKEIKPYLTLGGRYGKSFLEFSYIPYFINKNASEDTKLELKLGVFL